MAEPGWPDDAGRTARRAAPGAAITQVLLAAVAILAFLWLINILLEHPDRNEADPQPVLEGLAEAMSATAWIAVLLVLLGLILVAEILLLRPSMRKAVMRVEAWKEPEPEWTEPPLEPHAPQHLVGCPACGTVFDTSEHGIGDPADHSFGCPNCGRIGRVKRKEAVHAELIDVDCPKCAEHYQAYQKESECPNCGQHIRVKAER